MSEMTGAMKKKLKSFFGGDENRPDKLSIRNLIMFPLGTIGRDFLYNFFNNFLLTYILFTKELTNPQFASISIIIIAARIFDAFNDPIMGGIVENTRSKWGKFKPWQLIGAVLTGVVVIATFSTGLDGWSFIGYIAFIYFMFSITFTMNDISYWGMLPALSRNEHDRSMLTSFAQIAAGAGGGLAGLLVPALTTGKWAINGSAVSGFKVIAIISAVLLIGFQLFTILGVKEKPLPDNFIKTPRMSVKQMFKVIFKNDQLMWNALVMLIYCVGTSVVGGGLSLSYLYFQFGYNGMLLTLFGVGFSVTSTLFILLYPWLSKKFGRDKMLYSTGIAIVAGYLLMMLFGITLPNDPWYLKFTVLVICNTIVGYGQGFYMIMIISIANTVEYNEWKTGKRDEGLIFSIRPFTAKMGSALMQGVVMIVYIAVGVLTYTNQIAEIENLMAAGKITEAIKMERITAVINSVPEGQIIALLVCMCLIPAIFMAVAMIIYKKKCFINEKKYAEMVAEIEQRKLDAAPSDESLADADEVTASESFEVGQIGVIPGGIEALLPEDILTGSDSSGGGDNENYGNEPRADYGDNEREDTLNADYGDTEPDDSNKNDSEFGGDARGGEAENCAGDEIDKNSDPE